MERLATTSSRLSALSRRAYQNPYEAIAWPETLDRSQWCTSPELISLYATPSWAALSEGQRKRLSFWEAVNFFSLNIHGEKSLMEGLARRLYRPGLQPVAGYLHHFLDEENKHSVWFGTFCTRYAGKVYPDKKVLFPRSYADGEEDFLFFAQVAIFEDLVDRYNALMGRDGRLAPVVRQINASHHADEARHLAFGWRAVEELWRTHLRQWSPETIAGVRRHLGAYLVALWREYYNPDVYRDAGFAEPWLTAQQAWEHPYHRRHRRDLSRRCLHRLIQAGVLDQEPPL